MRCPLCGGPVGRVERRYEYCASCGIMFRRGPDGRIEIQEITEDGDLRDMDHPVGRGEGGSACSI